MKLSKNVGQAIIFFTISLTLVSCDKGNPQSAQSKIDRIAFEMKAKLPAMLDSDTRLIKVYTKNLELVSEYELVNYPATEAAKSELKGKIENYLKNQVCSDIKGELLSKGITSRYVYKTNQGEVVLELALVASDC